MARELRTYTIIRTVRELYEVEAYTSKEAKEAVAERGDPHTVTVVSEYAVWNRPPKLPKGYVALSIEFKKPDQ